MCSSFMYNPKGHTGLQIGTVKSTFMVFVGNRYWLISEIPLMLQLNVEKGSADSVQLISDSFTYSSFHNSEQKCKVLCDRNTKHNLKLNTKYCK